VRGELLRWSERAVRPLREDEELEAAALIDVARRAEQDVGMAVARDVRDLDRLRPGLDGVALGRPELDG
jgi:hypothetical protein